MTLSATLSGIAVPHMAGISGALEVMTRSLAGEFGPSGVRVNCVRGSAMPETRTIRETNAGQARMLRIEPGEMRRPRSADPSPSPRRPPRPRFSPLMRRVE